MQSAAAGALQRLMPSGCCDAPLLLGCMLARDNASCLNEGAKPLAVDKVDAIRIAKAVRCRRRPSILRGVEACGVTAKWREGDFGAHFSTCCSERDSPLSCLTHLVHHTPACGTALQSRLWARRHRFMLFLALCTDIRVRDLVNPKNMCHVCVLLPGCRRGTALSVLLCCYISRHNGGRTPC